MLSYGVNKIDSYAGRNDLHITNINFKICWWLCILIDGLDSDINFLLFFSVSKFSVVATESMRHYYACIRLKVINKFVQHENKYGIGSSRCFVLFPRIFRECDWNWKTTWFVIIQLDLNIFNKLKCEMHLRRATVLWSQLTKKQINLMRRILYILI